MKFTLQQTFLTGTAVPISALRSQQSCGIGEFLDLIPLGKWCSDNGLNIIQILPINDSGDQSSPYSALSAFALHPVYIHLDSLKGVEPFISEITDLRTILEKETRIPFQKVYDAKMILLQKIYQSRKEEIQSDEALKSWIKKNSWVREYAVFLTIKTSNNNKSWRHWTDHQKVTPEDIAKLWKRKTLKDQCLFYCWIQRELEIQLSEAVDFLNSRQIALKGDLPIMMNEDSVDLWAKPHLFDLNQRAGAPPDGFSPEGQNWGFPIYLWEKHREDNFSWWKKRLKQADKFFSAYRIDHVLGFFRLWTIPSRYNSGDLGYFTPHKSLNRQDFYKIGFDDERITWISEPHIYEQEIRDALQGEAEAVISLVFNRIANENLFRFKPQMDNHKILSELNLSTTAIACIKGWLRNRMFLKIGDDEYTPLWFYRDTRAYSTLDYQDQSLVETLITNNLLTSEMLWEQQGEELMSFMNQSTHMLPCAEDLGAVPACLPLILKRNNILSLKINRWTRLWDQHGHPFIPVKDYPYSSVSSPSVHDSSPLRQWWKEENDHTLFCQSIGMMEPQEDELSPDSAFDILRGLMETNSKLCIIPIQDLFAIEKTTADTDPEQDRINTPGTVTDKNWSYRIKTNIEIIAQNMIFNARIRELVKIREEKSTK